MHGIFIYNLCTCLHLYLRISYTYTTASLWYYIFTARVRLFRVNCPESEKLLVIGETKLLAVLLKNGN